MSLTKTKRALIPEEKDLIWTFIKKGQTPEDRDPWDVINKDYDGDEDEYLRTMARCLSLPLDLS